MGVGDWEEMSLPFQWRELRPLFPVVKTWPDNAGDRRDVGSSPGSGRSPRGRNSKSFQYSCLEHPRDRGAWRATVQSSKGRKESDRTEAT